ncbi:MAG: tRNA pseudouridine(55) synthase TruB [Thermodesulfovibrionales bacterium]|jgi:tRNA pseudouridine55 synthase
MNVVMNLNKPKGLSSQQAVTRVKRIVESKKAGHAGTLDPLATGVLVVCFGEATKITRFLADLDKEYIALMKLGEKTDTLDAEGTVIERVKDVSLERDDVEEVLEGFTGVIRQTPPMYSAVKIGGKPLYSLARKGIEVERPERNVHIGKIAITGFDPPQVEIHVLCSKGTYIRTLCADIGDALGVGAHVIGLQRTRIGDFTINDSVTMEELEELPRTRILADDLPSLWSVDSALRHLGERSLTEAEFSRARNGLPVTCREGDPLSGGFIRLRDPSGRLFAIGRIAGAFLRVERMLLT